MADIDNKDRILLSALQQNARLSNAALAEQASLSDTPCLRRVKKLQQDGVILGYHADISPPAVGYSVLVYAFIRLTKNSVQAAESFENHVDALRQVRSCSVVSGSHDYLLEIIAEDLPSYEHFVKHSLASLDFIAAVESTIVLKQTFNKRGVPL
ncbi:MULTISPECIES: Lrp/AsnC family transcriptional regulator [Pseudoalteromonas]|uniref:Transcriptional regulator n=1 Tax=Pseudoalteromonas luteoviolacea (strain 2ta16) TaxID=1353533 RepID=V4I004_PSEL2|nr:MULTISPECIES: Lrp/AsnC family transcriptional regulator [Pseudoalteromonas]ESP93559.1 transcriptional regulator [Pseudoalteromonas luteoviolacea 2ta16]KZN34446.1 transcriptional regulator [Pseudoalteromonas luteoviolacea NCIMB 1944]MCG7548736.1 Lrp/AsnC family transcriptional regulator [Pseudoalteromonas sp. Of7M-16]